MDERKVSVGEFSDVILLSPLEEHLLGLLQQVSKLDNITQIKLLIREGISRDRLFGVVREKCE